MLPSGLKREVEGKDRASLKPTKTVDKSAVSHGQEAEQKGRHGTPDEWQALSNKIFTRWVNQKLGKRRIKIDDIGTGLKDGTNLIALIELLSEVKFEGKLKIPANMRVQQIDNVNQALNFLTSDKVGVKLTLKPSAENIVDGNVKIILGMLWGVMLKFLKIGDEEELNAQDALLMWLQNQVNDYKGVSITNLTSSFHNGLALCALIHKFRPALVPFAQLDEKNGEANLQLAFNAAETFFGLEQYLRPSDVLKLDDKAMAVFLAEFYYGISEQRRLDLQARRIVKVIRYTVTNDQMKKDFNQQAEVLRKRLTDLRPTLDKLAVIDNTMAGAKTRLAEFVTYKTKHKGQLLSEFLSLETLHGQIARRLADGKRPEFVPAVGCSVKGLSDAMAEIEAIEGKLQVALHEEHNRQINLFNTNQRHLLRSEELRKWSGEKKLYLHTKEQVTSIGAATYQLNVLSDFDNEFKAIQASFAELKTTGEFLAREHFEDIKTTHGREQNIHTAFEELTKLAASKREVLDDDLAREKFAEQVRGWDHDHQGKYEKLQAFIAEKRAFLQAKPAISSVSDARLALDLLEAYESEKKVVKDRNLPPLKSLGEQVRAAKYETKISVWILPEIAKVAKREMETETAFEELDNLSGIKLKVLKDALSRELFREDLIRRNQQHIDKYNILDRWFKEKSAYLDVKEEIKSSSDAEMHLGLVQAYNRERKDLYAASVPPLKALGGEILTAEYKTSLSQYKWPTPEEIKTRESAVDAAFVRLDEQYAVKLKRLQDDLAREQFREKVELWNQGHIDKFGKIQAFISTSQRYLKKKDSVDSIPDAIRNLARIRQYFDDKKDNDLKFVALSKLGKEIKDAEYKTALSAYRFPTPQEVDAREAEVKSAFATLDEESKRKKAVLDDDLAREEFREKLRQWNVSHIDKFKIIQEFVIASKVYLGKRESVYSIADADLNLARIREYWDEKVVNDAKNENLKGRGKSILDAEYKTELSSFKFRTPEEIHEREKQVDTDFANLDEMYKRKLAILEDDLGREQFREKLRQLNLKHIEKSSKIQEFLFTGKQYLLKRDEVTSIAVAHLNLARLREFVDEKKINDMKFDGLRKLGSGIKTDEYKTPLSSYKFPTPHEIDGREGEITNGIKEIEELTAKKQAVLQDDLAREEFREELRQLNQDHIEKSKLIQAFINTNALKYLKTKEPVNSIADAQVNLDRIRAYFDEKKDYDLKNDALRGLGDKILKAEYKSALSTYRFPTPGEIKRREKDVELAFAELDLLSGEKDEAKAQGEDDEWLAHTADQISLQWGEDGDDDDDDDDEHRESAGQRAARRKSLKDAVVAIKEGKFKAGGKLAVLKDDLAREQFKQKLRRFNRQHADKFNTLSAWITENRAYLETKDPVGSIAEAEKNLARLAAYEVAKQDVLSVNVSALRKQGQDIITSEHKTKWSTWRWETPDEVLTREKSIADLFQILDQLSAKKKAILDDDLAREEFREKLRLAAQSHLDGFNNIKSWVVAMTATLKKKEEAKSISDANLNLASLNANVADKEAVTNLNVAFLKKKGAEILEAEYKTPLSRYAFPDANVIKSREYEIDRDWAMLDELVAGKREVLNADLRRELHKEDLRLKFANVARDTFRFATDKVKDCAEPHFGFTLAQVTAFKPTLVKEEQEAVSHVASKQAEFEKIHKELVSLGVTENVYTRHTPESLNKLIEELKTSLKARADAYAKELARHQNNDALCHDFATKAAALDSSLKSTKETINRSAGTLEKQLEDVNRAADDHKKDERLAQVRAVQVQIDDAKISNNPHTVLTIPDLEIGVRQLELFLHNKQTVLAQDIDHKNLRGISKEQHAEIDLQFHKFDKDKSGKLDINEFKTCLYSLGEEMGRRQVQAIMDRFAERQGSTHIVYPQFREFMIQHMGVNDTKELITEAFKDIAEGDEKSVCIIHFVPRRMAVFTEVDLQFFKDAAPKTEGRAESWVYPPFVEEVFAR